MAQILSFHKAWQPPVTCLWCGDIVDDVPPPLQRWGHDPKYPHAHWEYLVVNGRPEWTALCSESCLLYMQAWSTGFAVGHSKGFLAGLRHGRAEVASQQ